MLSRFEQRARTSIQILTAVQLQLARWGNFPEYNFLKVLHSTENFFFSKPMFDVPSALPAQCCQGDGFYPKGKGVTSSLVRGSRSRLSSLVTIILHCTGRNVCEIFQAHFDMDLLDISFGEQVIEPPRVLQQNSSPNSQSLRSFDQSLHHAMTHLAHAHFYA